MRSVRRFISLKKSPARFARRGKKLFLREGGENDFFEIYIPLKYSQNFMNIRDPNIRRYIREYMRKICKNGKVKDLCVTKFYK